VVVHIRRTTPSNLIKTAIPQATGWVQARGEWWYDNARFGLGFNEHLLDHYAYHGVVGAHAMYLPRCGLTDSELPPRLPDADTADTVIQRGGRPNPVRQLLNRLLHRE